MEDNIRVALKQTPINATQYLDADGRFYLDLPVDFKYRRTKIAERLREFERLEFNRTLGFSIDATDKNIIGLKNYLNVSIIGNNYDPIPIDFVLGEQLESGVELAISRAGTKLECLVMLDRNHWARRIKNIRLRDIDFGSFVHESKTVQQLHDTFQYEAADVGIWQALVDYGELEGSGDKETGELIIPASYERPLISPAHLLKGIFKEVGYQFEAPILLDDVGKAAWLYIIREDFGASVDERVPYDAVVSYNTDGVDISVRNKQWNLLAFPNVKKDEKGLWNPRASWFSGNVEINVACKLLLKVERLKDNNELEFRLVKKTRYAAQQKVVVIDEGDISSNTEDDEFEEIELKGDDIALFDSQYLAIEYRIKNVEALTGTVTDLLPIELLYPSFQCLQDSQANFICNRTYFQEDQEYNIADILPDMLASDFFKEMIRLFHWELETDNITRKVYGRSTYDFYIEGRKIEGHYKEDEVSQIESIIVPDSTVTVYPEKTGKRYIRTQFKDTSDKDWEEEDKREPIFSIKIDRGESYVNTEIEKRQLKYIEPTKSIYIAPWKTQEGSLVILGESYQSAFETIKTAPLHLARIQGNTDSGHHWDVGIRLLLARGVVEQGLSFTFDFGLGQTTTSRRSISRQGGDGDLIPMAVQDGVWIGESNVSGGTVTFDFNNFTFSLALAIGDFATRPLGLYFSAHYRAVLEEWNEPTIETLVFLDEEEFRAVDMRGLFEVMIDGFPVQCKLDEVRDFEYFSGLSTPYILRKINRNFGGSATFAADATQDIEPVNKPRLQYSRSANCYDFTIGGNNESAVSSVAYFYILKSTPNVTTAITNQSAVTAQLCDITEIHEVYAVVTYTGIVDTTTTGRVLIDPCVTDVPEIITTIGQEDNGDIYVMAQIGGQIQNTYSATVLSKEGSAAFVFYNLGDKISPVTEDVIFSAIVNFDDSCGAVTITATQLVDDSLVLVLSANFGIEFIEKFDGSQQISRTGGAPIGDYDDYIIYRVSANGNWVRWNEDNNISADYIQARRILIPLGSTAQTYGSGIITFEI
jgi:hypothetical protein